MAHTGQPNILQQNPSVFIVYIASWTVLSKIDISDFSYILSLFLSIYIHFNQTQ